MSSPIANTNKNSLENLVIKSHQKLSHNKRIDYLSKLFIGIISDLKIENTTVLDIGCGDMSIAENIMDNLDGVKITCLDTYPLPTDLKDEKKWDKYVGFDGKNIPFEPKTFDVAILCDVLHHDFENVQLILSEAYRVAKYVIIKDHFEYGMVSRQTLRLMDFIGNWAYGVSVPDRYFSMKTYQELLSNNSDLTEVQQICPIPLYQHSFVFNLICPGKLQFISILKNESLKNS
jgi:ubiquinone/menaquinone biosynthesis C-methylase UbiE